MGSEIFPKRLQIEGRHQEALDYYVKEYGRALQERDTYLSGLLMDEIARTIISSSEEMPRMKQLEEMIKAKVRQTLGDNHWKDLDADIEVQLRKRFPREFKESDEVLGSEEHYEQDTP